MKVADDISRATLECEWVKVPLLSFSYFPKMAFIWKIPLTLWLSWSLLLKTHLFKDVFIKKLCGYQHLSFNNECNALMSMFIWKGRNIK